MDYAGLTDELKEIIQPVLDEDNIELVELSFVRGRGNSLLRLLVDRRDGAINIGDCARLNRKLLDLLDTRNIIQDSYVLEVSSPGLDRPLKTKNDFLRCLGKEVKFFLNEAINGKIEIDAVICKVEDESVIIDTGVRSLRIPLSKVAKAKQVVSI